MINQEMTYEEAINYLLHCVDEAKSKDWASGIKFALATIEKATEQDCISRQAVLDALDKGKYSNTFCEEHNIDWSINLGMAHIVVNELKPATPQSKTGHWIEHPHEAGENWEFSRYECSECHIWVDDDSDYCPNCGAKMAESEDKE